MKITTDNRITKMNQKKIATTSKQSQVYQAVAIIIASTLLAAMLIVFNNSQNIQKATAQEIYPSGNNSGSVSKQ